MTEIKLIATDIDGTLFDSNNNYDIDRLNSYLKQLHEQNVEFAVASGNNLDHLQKIFQASPDIDILIAENGSQVVSHKETLFEKTISNELIQKIIPVLTSQLDLKAISLSGKKASYSESSTNQPLYHIGNLIIVDDLTTVDDEFFKLNIQLEHDDLDDAANLINQNYGNFVHAATSGFGSIDIMNADINKSLGLQQLCQKLNIGLDNVMAFGDNTNDLEMIQEVGLGVSMLNAKQSIKDAADQITIDDNNHDGVLNTIKDAFNF
ncbi:HAD family hydrolase [Companilactobacillus kimchiensis]|nr:HAD family hydrolase [Companilactobacillus kimchiensis]